MNGARQMAQRASAERKPSSSLLIQRKCHCGGSCDACSRKQTPGIVHDALSTRGQPLDSATRAMMESRFSHDFSHVRVHSGEVPALSAAAIGANAYTLGSDIVFRSAPSTRLLAHELAHVVQQSEGPAASPMTASVGTAGSPLEREADAAADTVAAGGSAVVTGRGGAIQRDKASDCTYGEIRSWAITSLKDHSAPAGLGDAKASIAAACAKNPCSCVDGSGATEAGDKAAWANIVAASGTDQSGGGELMCVGSEGCYFVHTCKKCSGDKATSVERDKNLTAVGTVTVSGRGTLYFYTDSLKGWCNSNDFREGCKPKAKPKEKEKTKTKPAKGKAEAPAVPGDEDIGIGEESPGEVMLA